MLAASIWANPDGFLLTRPLRDVTGVGHKFYIGLPISTHTPLAGRDGKCEELLKNAKISTHTPLAGRDALSMG